MNTILKPVDGKLNLKFSWTETCDSNLPCTFDNISSMRYRNHTARNTGYWPMASKPGLGADTNTYTDAHTGDNNHNIMNAIL